MCMGRKILHKGCIREANTAQGKAKCCNSLKIPIRLSLHVHILIKRRTFNSSHLNGATIDLGIFKHRVGRIVNIVAFNLLLVYRISLA